MISIILQESKYVQGNVPYGYRRILAKLRLGSLPLQAEVGNFCKLKVELENRIGELCNMNFVEDEIHFLTESHLYKDLQYTNVSVSVIWIWINLCY